MYRVLEYCVPTGIIFKFFKLFEFEFLEGQKGLQGAQDTKMASIMLFCEMLSFLLNVRFNVVCSRKITNLENTTLSMSTYLFWNCLKL
jgi:hypothetical protein